MIVGIGEVLWDVFPEGKQIGGAPANFAYHVSQFGLDSTALSAIGKDELGQEVVEVLRKKKLNCLFPVVNYPTGTVQVTLDAKGVPSYEIKEGVAWDNVPFSQEVERLARTTRVVCFGSLAQRHSVSRETIHRFLETMPQMERSYKIFDINLRQHYYTREVLEDSLHACNILKINDEELVLVSQLMGFDNISVEDKCWLLLGKYNLKMLILTCGTEGSYVFSEGKVSFLETPRVEVADTVGAGDSFTATFISAILLGRSIPEAHKRAVEVSAYVCTQSGAMPTLPEALRQFNTPV